MTFSVEHKEGSLQATLITVNEQFQDSIRIEEYYYYYTSLSTVEPLNCHGLEPILNSVWSN